MYTRHTRHTARQRNNTEDLDPNQTTTHDESCDSELPQGALLVVASLGMLCSNQNIRFYSDILELSWHVKPLARHFQQLLFRLTPTSSTGTPFIGVSPVDAHATPGFFLRVVTK